MSDLDWLRSWIREFVNSDYSDDRTELAAGVLLVAAFAVGPHIKPLKAATEVPWALVQSTSYYLRRGRVWVGGTMHYPWADLLMAGDVKGDIGFHLDVMVGAGYANRRLNQNDEPEYEIRQMGDGLLNVRSGVSMVEWRAQHDNSINVPKWPHWVAS